MNATQENRALRQILAALLPLAINRADELRDIARDTFDGADVAAADLASAAVSRAMTETAAADLANVAPPATWALAADVETAHTDGRVNLNLMERK